MATIQEIAQEALEGVGSADAPTSLVGSTNPTAKQVLSLLNSLGKKLVLEYDFNDLKMEHSFSTVVDTATYSQPSDFRTYVADTFWDQTNQRPLQGPISSPVFQSLKHGVSSLSEYHSHFRVIGNLVELYPTPSSVRTLSYEYFSKHWVLDTDESTTKASIAADTDTVRLDDELIKLAITYMWRAAKGEPYDEDYNNFSNYLMGLIGSDHMPGTLNLKGRLAGISYNLPETGYGS